MGKREEKVRIGSALLRLGHISELKDNPENARVHNARNIGILEESLEDVGAARSVAADENLMLMAGHGTTEAAANIGIEKVLFVETDGNTLVCVVRSGLTPEQKERYGIADNRTTDLSTFNYGMLAKMSIRIDKPLRGMFSDEEQDAIRAAVELMGEDEPEETQPRKRRIAFRLDFDDAEQKRRFEAFRSWLKVYYGAHLSEAERFIGFLLDFHPEKLGE